MISEQSFHFSPEANASTHSTPDCPSELDALRSELSQMASSLACRFEEISLIHGLNQRFAGSLQEDPSLIARALIEELSPCIGTDTLCIQLAECVTGASRAESELEQFGEVLPDSVLVEIAAKAEKLVRRPDSDSRGISIVNELTCHDRVCRVAVVGIESKAMVFGRMIGIRGIEQPEFGTIEADMMRSTSMMLAAQLINQRQFLQLQGFCESMIRSLAAALDAKDAYTSGHSTRVAELSHFLGAKLGYDDTQLQNIRMGGILHDIGKIGVDDLVLRKPGRLTENEFAQIKLHPLLGYEILQGIEFFRPILPAVRHHHESWDGSGYPDGLSGTNIPRDAQIMAVADAFDAMTSDRPYRPGMPVQKVIQILKAGRGQQWAADVIDVLLGSTDEMDRHATEARSKTSTQESVA